VGRGEKLAWVGYVLLASMLRYWFWNDMANYMRGVFEFYTFGVLILLGSPARPSHRYVLGAFALLSIFHLIASSDAIPNMY
jgi:hypothetical protein